MRQQTGKKIKTISLIMVTLLMSYCSDQIEFPVYETKPEITSTHVTSGIVNEQYIYDVNASGNPAPTYTLTTSPPGMTINNSTGIISWIPSADNDFKVGVTVTAANEFIC